MNYAAPLSVLLACRNVPPPPSLLRHFQYQTWFSPFVLKHLEWHVYGKVGQSFWSRGSIEFTIYIVMELFFFPLALFLYPRVQFLCDILFNLMQYSIQDVDGIFVLEYTFVYNSEFWIPSTIFLFIDNPVISKNRLDCLLNDCVNDTFTVPWKCKDGSFVFDVFFSG